MKPFPVSNIEIAKEFGIEPGSPNWKVRVRELRATSRLESDYRAALATWHETPDGQRELARENLAKAEKISRREKYEAAGMGHLFGAQVQRSKRGSVGVVRTIGGGKTVVVALAKNECEFLGYQPGPANA